LDPKSLEGILTTFVPGKKSANIMLFDKTSKIMNLETVGIISTTSLPPA
jgi:hypothetical protein